MDLYAGLVLPRVQLLLLGGEKEGFELRGYGLVLKGFGFRVRVEGFRV